MNQIRCQNQETGALLEPKKKKTLQETVRDVFTPSRVGMLSWAFAAVFMGTVGIASYQFGDTLKFETASGTGLLASGVVLPPAGDIETTASLGSRGQRPSIEVMNMPQDGTNQTSSELTQSQIEVMQKEIVGLRRRLMDLSEQNGIYSKRIAALEKEIAVTKLAGLNATGPANGPVPETTAAPVPGVVRTKSGPSVTEPATAQPATEDPPFMVSGETETIKPPQSTANQKPANPPRLISIYQDNRSIDPVEEEFSAINREPVRIVTLPQPVPEATASAEEIVTGSIPTTAPETLPEEFDSTPTRTTLEPTIITPSDAVGRLRSGSDSQLKRSDFGAVIGHYRSTASAAKAWADFKEQNEERMKDLRPLLLERNVPEGGISLLVGPFGNAADAAVACFHLLDVTELCHPALYAGDPLITAAEFRDSAFEN